jgi:hypothetical protein
MKFLLIFLFSIMSLKSEASCEVYIPFKEFHHAGYTIYFDFTKILEKKQYQETRDPNEARFLVVIHGQERKGRYFRHADVSITLLDRSETSILAINESVRCLTQYCSIGDFAKAFINAYKKFGNKLKICEF